MYMYIKVTQRLPELLYTFTFLLNLLKQHALKDRSEYCPTRPERAEAPSPGQRPG